MKSENLINQLELQPSDDESQVPASHNKLLGAVASLYEKKRVKAPTRKEPSLEVSEFHLSQVDKKRNRVKISDLASVLKKRASHVEISQKLKTAQKRAKTLPKPLEKIDADKITRAAGYEHARRQLNRWDAIVYKQRVADQVTFPLHSETIRVHQSTDLSKMFRKPTELEIKLAELLNHPNPLEEKKANEDRSNEEEKEIKEEDYPLSLAEVIEKRKMIAKLRAQESYRQAKAARHSKIKSKKFHQIQRRARVKEQLREFEELQKKDPEAALKKLEELERTRAEERASLRHRSTGQWAKNLSVRAKYDKEARIALSEQLSKSKELTVKLAQNKESESEKEDEEEEPQPQPSEDPNNPWVVKQSKEMEDFVSGFRRYWESEGKNKEENKGVDTSVRISTSKNGDKKPSETEVTCKENNKLSLDKVVTSVSHATNQTLHANEPATLSSPGNNLFIVNSGSSQTENKSSKQVSKFKVTNIPLRKGNSGSDPQIKKPNKQQSHKNSGIVEDVVNLRSGLWAVLEVNELFTDKKSNKRSNKNTSFQVMDAQSVTSTKTDSSPKTKDKILKTNELQRKERKKVCEKKVKSIEELFEEVEDKLQERIKDKVDKIKTKLGQKRHNNIESSESESDDILSLEMKKSKITADVDEELSENPDKIDRVVSKKENHNSLSKTVAAASAKAKSSEDIDPNKFLKVTPKQISSALPEMMTEGEDALDDEETTAADRHLTISEAFADDDVVDQFQKEKDEEMKKTNVGDVDLTLPGWGSWAGHNMSLVPKRKRKKFVIKFPKVIRRDTNRGNVIINEDADKPIKEHQVSELPFPFTSVEEYEASIRAPIGSTWVPQTGHRKLTLPPVVTKMGATIQPMDETQLVNKQKQLAPKKPNVKNAKLAKKTAKTNNVKVSKRIK